VEETVKPSVYATPRRLFTWYSINSRTAVDAPRGNSTKSQWTFQRFLENIVDVLFISHGKTGRAVALLQDYVRTENRFSANCRKIFFSKDEEVSLSLSLSLSSSVMTKIFETIFVSRKISLLYLPDRQLQIQRSYDGYEYFMRNVSPR